MEDQVFTVSSKLIEGAMVSAAGILASTVIMAGLIAWKRHWAYAVILSLPFLGLASYGAHIMGTSVDSPSMAIEVMVQYVLPVVFFCVLVMGNFAWAFTNGAVQDEG